MVRVARQVARDVTTRSTDSWFVYGSLGDSMLGASLVTTGVGAGTGVAVTPAMKSVKVEPTAPATVPSPPAPR